VPPLSTRYAGHYAGPSPSLPLSLSLSLSLSLYLPPPRRYAAGLIVISVFSLSAFFLSFFLSPSPRRARAHGFLSVIFPPPGNYVGAADQTREEADAARRKSRFAYLNPRERASERAGKGGGRTRKKGAFGSGLPLRRRGEMENGEGACATTMGRVCTPENWPTQKKRPPSRHETKTTFEKKKESKGKRLIGGHALTTLGLVTLALIRKGSSRQLGDDTCVVCLLQGC